jgi:hypothetical protein
MKITPLAVTTWRSHLTSAFSGPAFRSGVVPRRGEVSVSSFAAVTDSLETGR